MADELKKSVVESKDGFVTLKIWVGDKNVAEGGVWATYKVPGIGRVGDADVDSRACVPVFKAWIAGLSSDGLVEAFDHHCYAVDLKCRAKNRETVAAESTVITRGGAKYDLMVLGNDPTFSKACAMINSAFGNVTPLIPEDATPKVREEMLTKLVAAPFHVARRKLLEAKKVQDREGLLRPVGR